MNKCVVCGTEKDLVAGFVLGVGTIWACKNCSRDPGKVVRVAKGIEEDVSKNDTNISN